MYSDLGYSNLTNLLCYICYDFKPQRVSSVVFSTFPSFSNLLIIIHISNTIVKFFERFHFGIILHVMLGNIFSLNCSQNYGFV